MKTLTTNSTPSPGGEGRGEGGIATPLSVFELITEYRRPIAAIIPERIPAQQLKHIYDLIQGDALNQPDLAKRWNVAIVLSSRDWAHAQLKRVLMLPPKGVRLSFASRNESGSLPVVSHGSAVANMSAAFKITRLVCSYFDVTPAQLESSDRRWSYVWPRWCAIVLIKQNTCMSTVKIGILFKRTHGSVINALESMAEYMEVERSSAEQFHTLESQVATLLKPEVV
jgi:hypothetical protein